MKIIYQIGIIFSICWVSEVAQELLPFDFPASVIGMILLFALLAAKLIKVEHVQEKSDFLLSNMAFFFVPAGVSIMNYFDVLADSAWKLAAICLITTVLTFGATVYAVRATLWLMERRKGGGRND